MRRLLTLILALSMSVSVCLPVHAQYSFQEDAAAEAATQGESAAEGETDTESVESDTESAKAADNGENASAGSSVSDNSSAAAYGVDNLKGAPDITAESAILMDAASGAVLYGKDEESKQYPASITKVMTALLAIENCSMDDMLHFPMKRSMELNREAAVPESMWALN